MKHSILPIFFLIINIVFSQSEIINDEKRDTIIQITSNEKINLPAYNPLSKPRNIITFLVTFNNVNLKGVRLIVTTATTYQLNLITLSSAQTLI